MLNLYNEFYILFQIRSFWKGENFMLSLQGKKMFYNQLEFVFTLKPLFHVSRPLKMNRKCTLFKKEA